MVGICDMRDESVLNKIKIKTRKPAECVIRSKSVMGTPPCPLCLFLHPDSCLVEFPGFPRWSKLQDMEAK